MTRDRVHPGGLGGPHVERRVADVDGRRRVGAEALGGEQERLRVRLVALGLVPSDDRVEVLPERHLGERQLDRLAPLRRDDAEPPSLGVEAGDEALHPGTAPEILVQRLVVGPIDADELVHPLRVERPHLGLEAGTPDRAHELLVADLPPEHLAGGMAHRREDHARRSR